MNWKCLWFTALGVFNMSSIAIAVVNRSFFSLVISVLFVTAFMYMAITSARRDGILP